MRCIRVLAFQQPRQFCVPPLKKKGGGAPKGAHQEAASTDAAAPSESSASLLTKDISYGRHGGGSPLGAPPRRLPRQSRPWLSPGRVSWDVRRQALPVATLSQSSGAPRGPVIMPAEAMPEPPGSKVTSPARRNRIRPHQSAVTG